MTTKMAAGLETAVGTGEVDDVAVYEKILEDLGINVEKIWLLNSLIQAVLLLRWSNTSRVCSSFCCFRIQDR
ncbi:hypothetical protein L2E82_05706 [Cichorium intybus]|uniref:Uncharacterized protein n=1 Tax=Cichorium intybus TaxID=13427 RepID=A0ACB9H7J3_CICIN|nr:hypothetical protein L2E82_05706 [Cichorium intybus]